MRISDPNGLGHLASKPNGRTGETEAVTPSVQGGASSNARGTSSDRLELSSLAGRLSHTLAASSHGRAERVAALKAAVNDGTYNPDPLSIARSIVDYSVAAGEK